MKKIVLLFLLLSGLFISCDPAREFPIIFFLPKHYFSFSPEKPAYSVGDTMQIKIVIPKRYTRYVGGQEEEITKVTGDFYNKLTFKIKKNNENNIDFLLNDISVGEGELNFVFDNDKEQYELKEKVSVVFLKQGTFDWYSFFDPAPSVLLFKLKNDVQSFFYVVLDKENKTFKVEP